MITVLTLMRKLEMKAPVLMGQENLKGIKAIDKLIFVDQSPIGRSPLSNPVIYACCFDPIRQLFVAMLEAKA